MASNGCLPFCLPSVAMCLPLDGMMRVGMFGAELVQPARLDLHTPVTDSDATQRVFPLLSGSVAGAAGTAAGGSSQVAERAADGHPHGHSDSDAIGYGFFFTDRPCGGCSWRRSRRQRPRRRTHCRRRSKPGRPHRAGARRCRATPTAAIATPSSLGTPWPPLPRPTASPRTASNTCRRVVA